MKTTEAQFTRQVIDLATALGWRCYHQEQATRVIDTRTRGRIRVRNVNAQGVGFPDLVIVRERPAQIIFAELKLDRGPRGGTERDHVDPSDAQKEWLRLLDTVADRAVDDDDSQIRMGGSVDPHPVISVHVWRPADHDAIRRTLL